MFLVPRLGFGRTALRRFLPRFLLLLFHSLWSSPCRLVLQSAPLYLRRSTLELFLHLRLRSVFPLFPSWTQRVPFLFPAGFLKTGHTYLCGSACGSGPFGLHRGYFRSHLPCVGCHWQDHSASHARGRETSVGSHSNSGFVCSPWILRVRGFHLQGGSRCVLSCCRFGVVPCSCASSPCVYCGSEGSLGSGYGSYGPVLC